jgi:hypothetical protein
MRLAPLLVVIVLLPGCDSAGPPNYDAVTDKEFEQLVDSQSMSPSKVVEIVASGGQRGEIALNLRGLKDEDFEELASYLEKERIKTSPAVVADQVRLWSTGDPKKWSASVQKLGPVRRRLFDALYESASDIKEKQAIVVAAARCAGMGRTVTEDHVRSRGEEDLNTLMTTTLAKMKEFDYADSRKHLPPSEH